jgi:MFS family permease
MSQYRYQSPFNIAVLAAGLGFFIDAFDLFLFNVYRIPSLIDLGIRGDDLTKVGEHLLSVQMWGMMAGGILTGVLADKKGRVAALYGSIILYSLANIVNGFVHDIDSYAIIRFLAGMGLAGELGAGITLVGDSMPAEKRGYGTIMVATLGALGAVTAGLAGDFLPWRQAFITAGSAGFLLLLFRMKSMETGMYLESQKSDKPKGSLIQLFRSPQRAFRYFACILMGVPIWYSVGLLITLTPELAKLHELTGVKLSVCFILFQMGIASGDLSSGVFSQLLRSRKKILLSYMLLAIAATVAHFFTLYKGGNLALTSFFMGLGCGYLSVFVTSTSEHFGTNLRVTVTATVTNFMRGAVVVLIPLHQWFEKTFQTSLTIGLMITGVLVWILALTSVSLLPDTYGRNMNFEE